jgi:DNA topoisomerase I
MAKAAKLVIVESPTKARTIRKFLGSDYIVEASMGHVRDLPASADEIPDDIKKEAWGRLGVNVEDNFQPTYVIPSSKKKIVKELREALKGADELFLATDEDREGESIGWHLVEVLKPKVPIRRMVFHEITKKAIQEALTSSRDLNLDLVQAQETRRVLDRLVGYTISPLLWKKVASRLSAGRVQSVAVRLLVLRERQRMSFRSGTYWDLKARLEQEEKQFEAQLISVDDMRIASGKDFDEQSGQIPSDKKVLLLTEKAAKDLVQQLANEAFQISAIERKEAKRSPYPPFTTSTLQQEANRKLGLGANRTMRIAQRLYENGLITYMRTDSVHVADEAVSGIRTMIQNRYGNDYLFKETRHFATKSKGAQEAHEAIRPAGVEMQTSDELSLSGEQAKLYDLIWKRTVATQMAPAKLAFTTARFIGQNQTGRKAEFRASGREVIFPGFFRAYVEGTDDPEEALDDRNQPLPRLVEGNTIQCIQLDPISHETKPPARYTEASLVKSLEAEGIGRPSTYASIINTIQQRGYVMGKNKQLIPTFTALAVTQLLEAALTSIVDLDFTATMEERLDEIAEGKSALQYLADFYHNQLLSGVEKGGNFDAREICTIRSQNIEPHEIRVGRYGAFVQYGEKPDGKALAISIPAETPPSDAVRDMIDRLISIARRGETPLGHASEGGQAIYILSGPFGPYVQLGESPDPKDKSADKPKRVSVPKSIDPLTLELTTAQALLALPRELGVHPETQKVVRAGIGRYGPYVVHNFVYTSLKAEDNVLEVQLPRAIELLGDKKQRRKRSEPMKKLGSHPDDNEPVNVMEGPYGLYVKHRSTNATVPEGFEVQDISLDAALIWLAEKLERTGKKKVTKKKVTKKKVTKKKVTKKKVTKKKVTKKKATKKKATKKKTTKKKTTKKKTTKKKTTKKKATKG